MGTRLTILLAGNYNAWSSATKEAHVVWVEGIDGVIKLLGARGLNYF